MEKLIIGSRKIFKIIDKEVYIIIVCFQILTIYDRAEQGGNNLILGALGKNDIHHANRFDFYRDTINTILREKAEAQETKEIEQ